MSNAQTLATDASTTLGQRLYAAAGGYYGCTMAPSAVVVEDGVVKLRATRDANGRVTSGELWTDPFVFGQIDVVAQMPRGLGLRATLGVGTATSWAPAPDASTPFPADLAIARLTVTV